MEDEGSKIAVNGVFVFVFFLVIAIVLIYFFGFASSEKAGFLNFISKIIADSIYFFFAPVFPSL